MSRVDQKPHKFEHLYADFWNCLETELDLNQLCELLQKRNFNPKTDDGIKLIIQCRDWAIMTTS